MTTTDELKAEFKQAIEGKSFPVADVLCAQETADTIFAARMTQYRNMPKRRVIAYESARANLIGLYRMLSNLDTEKEILAAREPK